MTFVNPLVGNSLNSGATALHTQLSNLNDMVRGPMWINPMSSVYGAKGDGVTDDTAAIQAALDAAAAGGGGTVWLPGRVFVTSAQLNMKANVKFQGSGMLATVIKSSVSGNATFAGVTAPADIVRVTSPINASTAVHTDICHMSLQSTNAGMTGAGYDDIGGTYVVVNRVQVVGCKFGVIFDQTELGTIIDCDMENQTHSGIWIVNGPDHITGATGGLTNRITIERVQLNVPAQAGIWDDGGATHSIRDCNMNGGTFGARLAGIFGGELVGCEMESGITVNILTAATSLTGTGVGPVRQFTCMQNEIEVVASGGVDLTQTQNWTSIGNSFPSGPNVPAYLNTPNALGFISINDNSVSGPLTDGNPVTGAIINSSSQGLYQGLRVYGVPVIESAQNTVVTVSGALFLDASKANEFQITLQSNVTSTQISRGITGQRIVMDIVQDAVGSRTFAWPTNMGFSGGAPPTLTTTPLHHDSLTFRYDGANWIELSRSLNISVPTNVAFNTYVGTVANGDPWKLYVPQPQESVSGTPLIHYFHPYGASQLDLDSAPDNVVLQGWINAGWAVVVGAYSHGALDEAWGAPVIASGNQRAVETCLNQIDAAVRATRAWLGPNLAYAASMGCLNALDAFRYETGITNFKGLYTACGVFNLADLYAGSHQAHINTAYNIPAGGTYAVQTAGRDANLATAAQNVGVTGAKRFRYSFTAGDEVVHPDTNGANFHTNLAGVTGVLENSAIVAPDNGSHLSGLVYGAADSVAFFTRCLNGDTNAPTVPAAPVVVTGSITTTAAQIAWKFPVPVPANIAGWNVYLDGIKQNGSLIPMNLFDTSLYLHTDGNTSTNTSWTTASTPFAAWMAQVGQPIFGDGMAASTTVAAFISSSSITLSAATGVTDNLNRLRYVIPANTIFTFSGLGVGSTHTAQITAVSIDGVESAKSAGVQFTTSSGATGPSKVQSAQSLSAGATTTSRTATFGVAATANNLLVASFVIRNPGETPTAPTGWTAVAAAQDMHFNGKVFMCYKVAAGGETGITFSWTTAALSELLVEEWTATTTSPSDTVTIATSGDLGVGPFTTVTETESAVPSTTRSVSFALVGLAGGSGVISAPSTGWTHEVADNSTDNVGIIVSSQVFTSVPGSAPAVTETWTTGQRAAWVIAGFKGT